MSDEDSTTTADDAPEATTTDEPTPDQPDSLEEPDDKDQPWDPERAKRKIAKLNSEAANLRKRLNETPKVEDVAAKDRRITDLETASLRYEIALDLGLPKEIAARLQGASRDEMVADAEQLIELLAPAKRPASRRPAEALRTAIAPDSEPEVTDPNKIAARMFRN